MRKPILGRGSDESGRNFQGAVTSRMRPEEQEMASGRAVERVLSRWFRYVRKARREREH